MRRFRRAAAASARRRRASASRAGPGPRLARAFEQLACVEDGGRGDLLTAEHSRQLGDALLVLVEPADARARLAAGVLFPNEEVNVRAAGDLRQVRHADDLIALRELLQFLSDNLGPSPTDTRVNFIEYQC